MEAQNMKPARTFLLFLLVLGLGVYIVFVDQYRDSTAEREDELRRAFRIDPARTTRIAIRRPEYEIEMTLQQQEWVLTHPRGTRAQEAIIRQTLSRLRTLTRGELITPADMRERGQTLADFGLAVPSLILTLEDNQGTREYRVGNPNPLGNALFVKEESSQNIMLVSTDLLEILPTDPTLFRDRRLIPFSPDEIRTLTLRSADRVIRLERNGGPWLLTEPSRFPANEHAVQGLLDRITQARIESFADAATPEDETYGLDAEAAVLRAMPVSGQEAVEIRIGAGVSGQPGLRYARFAGRQGVFVVSEGVYALARMEEMALRDPRVLPLEAEAVTALSLWSPEGAELRLRRGETGWSITRPAERAADEERILRLLELWTTARVEDMLHGAPDSEILYRARFDVEQPGLQIPRQFTVRQAPDLPGRVWIQPEGSDTVWQVVPDILARLPTRTIDYQSRVVLRFDPSTVIRVNVQQNGESVTFTRTGPDAAWTGEGVDPNPVALHTLLSSAARLRAEDLLEDSPASFVDAADQEGTLRLSFGLSGGDTPNRTLLLRQPDPDQPMTGLLLGGDTPFRLSAEISSLLRAPLHRVRPPPSDGDSDDSPRSEED